MNKARLKPSPLRVDEPSAGTKGGNVIIWGWRAVSKAIGHGSFFCPNEGVEQSYTHKSARRWFTLFFIPVIPLDELGTYVECDGCRQTYNEGVLQLPTPATLERTRAVGLRAAVAMVLSEQAGSTPSDSQRDAAVGLLRDQLEVNGYDHATLQRDLTISSTELNRALHELGGTLDSGGQEQVLRCCMEVVLAGRADGRSRMDLVSHVGTSMGMSPAHTQGVIDDVLQTRRLSGSSPTELPTSEARP